jgi:ABC-type multidrug transport system ATPase subunit
MERIACGSIFEVMLELKDVQFTIAREGDDLHLLKEVSLRIPPGHFMAIVGPSGCGKTTLLKVVAGLQMETGGTLYWRGKDIGEDGDIEPQELGYVPQFSIAYDHLTVEECVENAVRLRTRESGDAFYEIVDRVVAAVGMESMREKRVSVLSGGQKRRLGLGMELVSRPQLLLCDEVTSGLDPQSERDIVQLLHALSQEDDRIVINVTHSLSNMDLYGSVLVMFEGRIVYHGPPGAMAHYFSVASAEDVYPQLAKRPSADWHESWQKYRGPYYEKMMGVVEERGEKSGVEKENGQVEVKKEKVKKEEEDDDEMEGRGVRPAGFGRQFRTLLARRWKLFMRDRTQLVLQLALLFGFPVLVVIFASQGIDPMPDRSVPPGTGLAEAIVRQTAIVEKQTKLGALVSGLVMFQVVLLTLMGSNNSAREIAGERLIYEKERMGGVTPLAYLSSKVVFLAVLAAAQAVWMGLFVDYFTDLPGDFGERLKMLLLVNFAMTSVCLAISGLMKSPEQASLMSIYLVGFQLPLSGAVLALPAAVERVVQPLIVAYWSWSGQLSTMRESDYFLAVTQAVPTTVVSASAISAAVLMAHILTGLVLAWLGCKRHRWD